MNNDKEFNIGDEVYFKTYRLCEGTIIAKDHPNYIIEYIDHYGNTDIIDRRSDYDYMILLPVKIKQPEKIEKKKSWWQKLFN